MKQVLAVLAAGLLSAGTAVAADELKTSGPLAERMAGKRVLLISAHPDDEGLFAPLMAEVCRFRGGTCHLVVAAEAKSPGCQRTLNLEDRELCSSMRRQETAASAANLNATHEFFGWEDLLAPWNDAGLERNLKEWAEKAGGHDKLLERIGESLQKFRPDFLLGFDPRHGTSCHPGHRAILLLTLEALEKLPPERRPEVWLESDFAVPTTAPPELAPIIDGYGVVRWPGDPTATTWYDANVAFANGRTGWDYLVDAFRLNATQFPEVASGKITPSPPETYRRIPFVRLSEIQPKQRGMCEPYTPKFSLAL